jgi:hypothetical protein
VGVKVKEARLSPFFRVFDYSRLRLLDDVAVRLSTDLFVDLLPQELCDHPRKGWIVHVTSEYLLVLVHAVDELAFQGLVENVLEVLQRVDHGGLQDVRVGDRFLADLVKEKLVGGV